MRFVPALASIFLLVGCVSVEDINHSSRKIENAWLLDYQRVEESHRTRVIAASASETFLEVKKTLVDLNLPILRSDMKEGTIVAQGIAPQPLNEEEWLQVVEIENPRVRELSNGWMYLAEDPSDYVLTVQTTVRGFSNEAIVLIEYTLSAPRYEAMGFRLPRVAPPEAVLIGSTKFWKRLNSRLKKVSKPAVRKLKPGEQAI